MGDSNRLVNGFSFKMTSAVQATPTVKPNGVKKLHRNPKNRTTKVHLIFDEKKRKEFLTGFRKRKAERKKKYEEKMKKEIKEERKRLQTELRAKIKKSSSNRRVPEIEHLIDKPHVFELPEHTVTITSISDNQYRDENIFLGINTAYEQASDEEIKTLAEKKKEIKDVNRKTIKKAGENEGSQTPSAELQRQISEESQKKCEEEKETLNYTDEILSHPS